MKKIFSAIIAITILLSVLAFAPSGVVADDDLTALSVAEDITEAVAEGEAEGEEEVEPEKIYGPDNTICTLSRPVINYTGTVQRTLVTVTDFDGNSLVYKKDFTVDYSDWSSTQVGEYTVTVIFLGDYYGTVDYTYKIIPRSDVKPSLNRTVITYTGTVQRPLVTVADKNGKALTYKTDFTVNYSNWSSTNVGEYTVTVNLIGKYSGFFTYTYKIVPQTDVRPVLSRTVIICSNTVQRPLVTVTDKYGNSLVYKKDFTVSYSNWSSSQPGCYTVTAHMMGNYSGNKTYKYYIDDKNCLPLNKTATHISYEYANVTKEVFGKSYQGRNLEAFIITPKNNKYTKTFVMNFAIHGFEDWYSRDGQVLTAEANSLVQYYASNPDKLRNFRLVIIPCLNPDGTIAGTNNNRANSTAFGRCTANHIDMNRDFPSCNAVESRAFKALLSKYRPDVYTDFHGWLDKSIGTTALCNIYSDNMNLTYKNREEFYGTYLYTYVHNTYRCPSALLEYKSPYAVSHYQTYTAINQIIYYYS